VLLFRTDLPKFFCDQCDYYSLRSTDLIQHYKMVHHRSDENGRSDKEPDSRVFSCDMCLFETRNASQLRAHYTDGHRVHPTEVQLRPSWSSEAGASILQAPAPSGVAPKQLPSVRKPDHNDIPIGIKCESWDSNRSGISERYEMIRKWNFRHFYSLLNSLFIWYLLICFYAEITVHLVLFRVSLVVFFSFNWLPLYLTHLAVIFWLTIYHQSTQKVQLIVYIRK